MKTEDLKAWGLTDEQVSSVMEQFGKDITKLQKENERLTTDRDTWKGKAETAETTLKGFEGVDLETMQKDLADWKKKAEDAEKNAQAQLYERDFNDALKAELENIKFSSDAAKRAIMTEIKASDLKLRDGKILGLNDLISQMKEKDASAFIDEGQQRAQQSAARFTTSFNGTGTGGAMTKADFKAMSLDERIALKQKNPELYNSLKG